MLKLKLLSAAFLLLGYGLHNLIPIVLGVIVFVIIKTPGND